MHADVLYPFVIYAKTEKENVTIGEIEEGYEKMVSEL